MMKPAIFLVPVGKDAFFKSEYDLAKVDRRLLLLLKEIKRNRSKKHLVFDIEKGIVRPLALELKRLKYIVKIQGFPDF